MSALRNRSRLTKTIFSVSSIVVIAKILGFLKQAVNAAFFGATTKTDIISLAEGVITDVDYLIVQALITAFIPIYIGIKDKDERETKKFVSNTLFFFVLLSATITILLELLAPIISRIIAPSYENELSGVLANYIRLLSPLLIVIVINAIFNALLKANNRFIPGELVSVIQSLISITLAFAIGSSFGADTIALSFFVYSLVNLIYLGFLSKSKWSIQKGNPFIDKNVIALLKMLVPMLLSYAMIYINQQVDKILVSGMGEGVITSMHYAATLSNFVNAFITSTCVVIFVHVTNAISNDEHDKAASLIVKFGIVYFSFLLPISILTFAYSNEIVTIVFGRGAFDKNAVANTMIALMGYSLMFVPFAIRELFSRLQYGYHDTKHPMINCCIAILINIALSIILSRFIGVLGVTIATSISVFVAAILNMISGKAKAKVNLSPCLPFIPIWVIGGIVCFIVSVVCMNNMSKLSVFIRFAITVIASLSSYALIVFPFFILKTRKKYNC